jgi:hypothetical protein
VDTVVTRCRGREIDKKMSRQRYTTPETHGNAMTTQNGQSSLSSFFYRYIGAACVHVPFFYFLFCSFFFTNLNWAKAVWAGPGAWGQTASALLREPAIEARHARARLRTGTRATAETVWGAACAARSTQETVWGAARGIAAIFFFFESRDRVQEFQAGRSDAPPRETPASEGSDLRSFFFKYRSDLLAGRR